MLSKFSTHRLTSSLEYTERRQTNTTSGVLGGKLAPWKRDGWSAITGCQAGVRVVATPPSGAWAVWLLHCAGGVESRGEMVVIWLEGETHSRVSQLRQRQPHLVPVSAKCREEREEEVGEAPETATPSHRGCDRVLRLPQCTWPSPMRLGVRAQNPP